MNDYVLGVEAAADLNEIWDYIAQDAIDAADRWIQSFFVLLRRWRRFQEWGMRAKILPLTPYCSGRLALISSSTGFSKTASKLWP
jgi:plasmid stabilization system protein ParE